MSYRNCDGIEFLRSLPAQSVDGIVTDPPWGGRTKIQGQKEYLELVKAMDSGHPCARPIEVSRALLLDWFIQGEYIVDPFAGSDTTGVACREMLNPYDTCEIDPKMYVYGKRRHSQMLIFENKEVFQ